MREDRVFQTLRDDKVTVWGATEDLASRYPPVEGEAIARVQLFRLPHRQRRIALLILLGYESPREIANELGCSKSTVQREFEDMRAFFTKI